ncbi:MAG: dTMP kinase [Dongiaceae bacterium]
MKPVAIGKFITLEGGEAAGKSTQGKLLLENLTKRNISAIFTREPGGTPEAEAIRNILLKGDGDKWDPMSEALLFFAARRSHVHKKIIPALNQGQWVICDRFTDSTLVYQGIVKGLGLEKMEELRKLVLPEIVPDLTLIIDVPLDVAAKRLSRRAGLDRLEEKFVAAQELFQQGFHRLAKNDPIRYRLIDGSGSIPEVQERILKTLEQELSLPKVA